MILWKKVFNIEGAEAKVHECEMNDYNVFAAISGEATFDFYSIFILDHDGNVAKSIKISNPPSYLVSHFIKSLTLVEDALYLLMWTNQNTLLNPIFVQLSFS